MPVRSDVQLGQKESGHMGKGWQLVGVLGAFFIGVVIGNVSSSVPEVKYDDAEICTRMCASGVVERFTDPGGVHCECQDGYAE